MQPNLQSGFQSGLQPDVLATRAHDRALDDVRRRQAFLAAGRHSARVRLVRRLIILGGAVTAIGFVAVLLFDPFSHIAGKVSLVSASINGSQITMELPKLSGFRTDGRPYDVKAASGVQDLKTPNIITLKDIDARMTTADNTVVRLVSPLGIYDSSKDFMRFTRTVHITSETGYDARLKSAEMDFKAGTVVSNEPVTVATRNFTIAANQLQMSEGGTVIVFSGDVRSTLLPAPDSGVSPVKPTALPAQQRTLLP